MKLKPKDPWGMDDVMNDRYHAPMMAAQHTSRMISAGESKRKSTPRERSGYGRRP